MNIPASLQAGFQGTAASFTNSLSNEAAADPGRAGHRLHRARRAVRELHPSHHHSFHAALGRRRRAAGADALSPGPERGGDHRHHPADRHREEERHHDGRLRPGSRARARQELDRCDLRGQPAALPPHHDDHHGRAARRPSAGLRHGHRLGAAPAAGHRHGRRPAAEPGAHALHHAGHLHLLRQSGAALLAASRATARPAIEPQPAGRA